MADDIKIKAKLTVEGGNLKQTSGDAKNAGEALNKTARGAQEADRALKGAAGASSNTTKNFAKMAQGINGGLVPAYATLAANIFALSAAFNYLKSAGQLKQLEEGQVAYSSATGKGMKSLTNALVAATEAQLNYEEAAQAGAIGVAAGLNVSQVTALGKAAKDVSGVLGRDLTDSFNRLVRGVTKAEPELLDELGIILRLDTATQNYIRTMGIQGRALTVAEKTQAVYLETITQVNDKYGQLEDQIDPIPWQVLSVQLDRINRQIKAFLTEYLAPVAIWFSKNMGVMGIVFLPLIKSITSAMIPGLSRLGDGLENISLKFKNMAAAATEAKAASIAALTPDAAKIQAATALAAANVVPTSGVAATVATRGALTGKQISSQLTQIRQIESGSTSKSLSKDLIALRANKKAWEDYKIALLKMAEATYTSDAALEKVRAELLATGTAATVTARGFNIGAIAVRGFAIALNAVNWIITIASIGALVYSLFKARNATEELTSEEAKNAEAAARFRDATSSLTEEFKSFNETQERLLYRSGDVIGYFSNLSNRILTVGSAFNQLQSERLRSVLPKEIEEFTKQVQQIEASKNISFVQRLGAAIASSGTGVNYVEKITDQAKTAALSIRLVDAAIQEGAPESVKALADIAMQYTDISEGIRSLPEGISQSAPAVVALTEATRRLTEVTLEELRASPTLVFDLIADIQRAEQGVQRLALKTQGFMAARNEFIRVEADVIRNVFNPTTQLEGQLNTINTLLVEHSKLREDLLLKPEQLAAFGGDSYLANLDKTIARAKELSSILTTLTSLEREAALSTELSRVAAERDVIGLTSGAAEIRMRQASLEQAKIEQGRLQTLYETKRLQNDIIQLTEGFLDSGRIQEENLARLAAESADLKVQALERQIDLTKQLYDATNQALETGLTTNIAALIKGEESSIKDAMLSIANGMLTSVADTLAKQLTNMIMGTSPLQTAAAQGKIIATSFLAAGTEVASRLSMAIRGTPGSFTTSVTNSAGVLGTGQGGFTKGGLLNFLKGVGSSALGFLNIPGFATGGVVTSPTLGVIGEGRYNEAIVPLPNGKAIPVQMNGAGQQNNVTVNVSVDSNGNASSNMQQDSQQAGNLGQVIARAVQQELQNQKRSGGILNPYGAA